MSNYKKNISIRNTVIKTPTHPLTNMPPFIYFKWPMHSLLYMLNAFRPFRIRELHFHSRLCLNLFDVSGTCLHNNTTTRTPDAPPKPTNDPQFSAPLRSDPFSFVPFYVYKIYIEIKLKLLENKKIKFHILNK